jgi:hypothetical protein
VKVCVKKVELCCSLAHLLHLSANHVKYYYNKLRLSLCMQSETNHNMTDFTCCGNQPERVFKKLKWSRYRLGVAQRVGRGIALLFHARGTRRGWAFSSTPRPHFTPGERSGTHCTIGWVCSRAGLNGRNISSPPGFDHGPSSPSSVAIPSELLGPQKSKWNLVSDIITRRNQPVSFSS